MGRWLDVVLLDDWEAEVVQRSHVAINLRTLLSGCVDLDASDVEVAPWAPQHIMHARRLTVRCPAEVPAIFRLDEFVQIPLLSDAAAARVRSLEGLRGVEVVHTDDYRGASTAP